MKKEKKKNAKVNKETYEKVLDLLCDMTTQADQDTPSEYRTRHFNDTMDECYEFLVEQGILELT